MRVSSYTIRDPPYVTRSGHTPVAQFTMELKLSDFRAAGADWFVYEMKLAGNDLAEVAKTGVLTYDKDAQDIWVARASELGALIAKATGL